MARNCADFHIIGNVARIAALREELTKVTIASNYRRKKGDEWVDEARFNTVNFWGSDAKYAKEKLEVGDLVRAVGTIQNSEYKDSKTGDTVYSVDLNANEVARLAKRQEKADA
jgi:single-strand DNA-binding protein